jgi:hypothetical protein
LTGSPPLQGSRARHASSAARRRPIRIGNSTTFWLFALFCGIAWIWIYFSVPETKGQSLEQIQQLWMEAGK